MNAISVASLLNPWIIIGFAGQFVFFLRFIVQWLVSEKKKQVVIPISFWYLSIAGTIIILIYSIHIHDIVFITAQILSLFLYGRNLMITRGHKPQLVSAETTSTDVPL